MKRPFVQASCSTLLAVTVVFCASTCAVPDKDDEPLDQQGLDQQEVDEQVVAPIEGPESEALNESNDGAEPAAAPVKCSCKTCNYAGCCNMPLGSCGCQIREWWAVPPKTCADKPPECIC
jgi:hypothetical protein